MRVLILNGNPEEGSKDFDKKIKDLEVSLKNEGHDVRVLYLRTMNVNYCVGCFGCWVKTPGECIFKDEGVEMLKEHIKANVTVLASPVKALFISHLLKNAMDRFLPMLCAKLKRAKGLRVEHYKRYERMPRVGFFLEKSEFANEEDYKTIYSILTHMSSKGEPFMKFSDENVLEITNEITRS